MAQVKLEKISKIYADNARVVNAVNLEVNDKEFLKKLNLHPKLITTARVALDYGLIFVGAVILAANVSLFLEPNNVISSGVTGIGM